ncbi:MAG: hypothetical protein WCK77_12035 [Verrucomicrobiota bacterium]
MMTIEGGVSVILICKLPGAAAVKDGVAHAREQCLFEFFNGVSIHNEIGDFRAFTSLTKGLVNKLSDHRKIWGPSGGEKSTTRTDADTCLSIVSGQPPFFHGLRFADHVGEVFINCFLRMMLFAPPKSLLTAHRNDSFSFG